MQHKIILRAALWFTLLLFIVALGFSVGTTERDRRLEAHLAAGRAAAAGAAAEAPRHSSADAIAAYEKRCAKCHEPEEAPEWLARQPGDREATLLMFLTGHKKAPDDENRLIAWYFAQARASSTTTLRAPTR